MPIWPLPVLLAEDNVTLTLANRFNRDAEIYACTSNGMKYNVFWPNELFVAMPEYAQGGAQSLTVTPPPAAPADKLKVNPALFDAVVPDRFVRARVGFPWLWLLSAAVVIYGPMDTEIPLDAIVPEAEVPANAAVACTKSEPRLLAIAVVSPSWEAVTVDAAIPKDTPLEFENMTVPVNAFCVPALIATPPPTAASTLTEIPLEAIVPDAFVPAKAALDWTNWLWLVSPLWEAVMIIAPSTPPLTPPNEMP